LRLRLWLRLWLGLSLRDRKRGGERKREGV
jgi:hypothetical protein